MIAIGSQRRQRRVAGAVAIAASALLSAALLVGVSSGGAGAASTTAPCSGSTAPVRSGTLVGMPLWSTKKCPAAAELNTAGASSQLPYEGDPPLIFNGGPVMGTAAVGSHITVTPIFWSAPGVSFGPNYASIIQQYLGDVAADSGKQTNVFSTISQYTGNNGTFNYNISVTAPLIDTATPYGTECTPDAGAIYQDNSGYTQCVDDAELRVEIKSLIAANHLSTGLGHIYPIFLPKHVESCFLHTGARHNGCTINPTPTAAYCAYHSYFYNTVANTGIYAAMPFPVNDSPVGFTCAVDPLPNIHGDSDADAEISPLSHEMSEAFSDPMLNAWFDDAGFENGDDCAYIYGAVQGNGATRYNQVINGDHWLTQEEFSNANFVPRVSGCVQYTAPVPTVTSISPVTGPSTGGQTVTITGTNFTNVVSVRFGKTKAASFTVVNSTTITAVSPAHAAGAVTVSVTTAGGASAPSGSADYLFVAAS